MAYDPALKRVLEAAGGPTKLARHLGVVPSAITQWSRVPPHHAVKIAELTQIPEHELRPDIFRVPK